jgi:hypothetical protein
MAYREYPRMFMAGEVNSARNTACRNRFITFTNAVAQLSAT